MNIKKLLLTPFILFCALAPASFSIVNPLLQTFAEAADGGDPVGADGGDAPSVFKLANYLTIDNLQDLLAALLSAAVQIAIPFLVLFLMWVGFLFVAARGNPEKLSKAKQALLFTLIGALIILGAQTLSVILSGTIGQLINSSTQ